MASIGNILGEGMADHVVWDWNGTLWDDLPQVHHAVNAALREVGAPMLGLSEYVSRFTRPLPLFYRRVLGREITDSEWERINHRFEMSYLAGLHLAGLASEAPRALETVARSGATQSILSLYPHDPLNALARELGISHYFTRIDGLRGASGRSKVGMFGGHLRRAAAGVHPGRIAMIGDTDDDLEAAREAGSACILINHHGDRPLGAGPDLDRHFADGLLAALRKAGIHCGETRPTGSQTSGFPGEVNT